MNDGDYIPDQWDSIFESFDEEEDRKEAEKKQQELADKQQTASMAALILEKLKDILKKGPRQEMSREVKQLLRRGKKGFSGGDPKIYDKLDIYVLEDRFLSGLKELCESYEIDNPTYNQFLRRLYPNENSQKAIDMRAYLYEKKCHAPNPPLKKMNYPLAAAVFLLVYGLQFTQGTDPVISLLPACLVEIHWFFYRLLYHRYRGPGSHVRICFIGLYVILAIKRSLESQGIRTEGLIPAMVYYFDFFFIIGSVWMVEAVRESGLKKNMNNRGDKR